MGNVEKGVKKIALIGPGYGHNILPYLDFFERNSDIYSVDFFHHTKNEFEDSYPSLRFVSFPGAFIKMLWLVRKYDVIWLQGGGKLMYFLAILSFLKRKDTKIIMYPYNESFARATLGDSIKSKFQRFVYSRFDVIHCGWFGVANLFHSSLKNKIMVYPLGLSADYYKQVENPSPEITELIGQIEQRSFNFYYPKSFTYSSRHDLVVQAVALLKKRGQSQNFKIYFIAGNVEDATRFKEINEMISKLNLEEDIIILKKKQFFSTEEFNLVWSKMDCGLQIAEKDIISNTIFEPLINKKELIISDIPAYRYLNDYFEINLHLTPLNAEDIANEMEKKINQSGLNNNLNKNKIAESIKTKYSFDSRFNELIENLV